MSEVPEGLELKKDGTVAIQLDDQRIVLKRPKMRELREFRQAQWEIVDESNRFVREGSAELDALRDKLREQGDEPNIETAREISAVSTRLSRTTTEQVEPMFLDWAVDVIAKLGGREVDGDDLPPWCATAPFANLLITHWQTVPTRHG